MRIVFGIPSICAICFCRSADSVWQSRCVCKCGPPARAATVVCHWPPREHSFGTWTAVSRGHHTIRPNRVGSPRRAATHGHSVHPKNSNRVPSFGKLFLLLSHSSISSLSLLIILSGTVELSWQLVGLPVLSIQRRWVNQLNTGKQVAIHETHH